MPVLPIVIQCNKRDLPNAMPSEYIKSALQVNGLPSYEAIATQGTGVLNTLKAIVGSVINATQRELK